MSNYVTYTYEQHLITKQAIAEKAYLARFEREKPSLENAIIIVNPYFINPLAAIILFKSAKEAVATLTIHGKDNAREDIVHSFAKGNDHFIPVIGLYDGITKVSITLSTGEAKTFEVQAEPLPANTDKCTSISTSIDYFGTDFMFLSAALHNPPMAIDYAGNIRWLLSPRMQFNICRAKNGNILIGSPRFSRMPYHTTGVWEMNLLGKLITEYRMPGCYHHDHWELENGNIMALTQDFSTETVEDMLALIDRKTGEVLKTWDYKNFLPYGMAGSGSQDARDWFHNNALWVDEKNKTVTLSGRHQDAIVNFSYEENDGKGKLNWIIGDPEGWSEEWQKYFFTPKAGQKDFDWQYEQHACVVTPTGDVMCFDNGQYRAKKKENYIKNRDNFSRGVRYKLDTDKMEIEQVWQYGKELGQSFFSPFISGVEYYAEGHYMIHSGGIATGDGYATDELAPFVKKENFKDLKYASKTIEQKDGVVMYCAETNGIFYRAERLHPYHDGDNFSFGEGKILGKLDITPTFDSIPEVEEVMQLLPKEHELVINEEEDKIVFTGNYERGSLVMLLLEGKDTHAYFINTAADEHHAMCSGAFLEKSDKIIKLNVSKEGLKGAYAIKFIINDKKYQSGVTLYC